MWNGNRILGNIGIGRTILIQENADEIVKKQKKKKKNEEKEKRHPEVVKL